MAATRFGTAYDQDMPSDRIVYSTDGGHLNTCFRCGKLPDSCRCRAPSTSRIGDGIVRIALARGGRHGKTVSVITGIPAGPAELDKLAGLLKRHCGSGGTTKGAAVEIQGDHRERLAARLRELGFSIKLAGG